MKRVSAQCGEAEPIMSCGDSPAKREEERHPADAMLPKRARQTNWIRRLWSVLAQRAQWNQHGCHSGWRVKGLGGQSRPPLKRA